MRDTMLRRAPLVRLVVFLAIAAFFNGCGSDGPSGPENPVGKYPLTGTATINDVFDVGDHAGVKLSVLDSEIVVTSTTNAADGSFTISALADGDYTLKASRDFYSTITRELRVRNGLLVDPLTQLTLQRTFSVTIRTDSLSYTHKSDSVYVWMVLKNENSERLDLFNSFVIPYDFVVYDPSEGDEEIWRWSLYRPKINDERYDFIESIGPRDSLLIYPPGTVRAWGKADEIGTPVAVGTYEIEGSIELIDDRGQFRMFLAPRNIVKVVP